MAEEMNTEKQAETPSAEKSSQDGSGRVEKQGDTGQRILSSPTRSHLLPSTQTMMVPPLSRTEGPRSRPLPLEGTDREANVQKLAGLEKEVQRLQRILGLEITKATQGTMTTADSCTEKPKEGLPTPPASGDCREVGCQTDMVESSSSSGSPAQVLGLQGGLIQGQRAVCGLKEQPEQNRPRKEKIETPSRMRSSDSETCEDRRLSHESIRDIRNNVVVLLTALLPQLDLTGISVETDDVDNILQQIIEVNSLKM